MLEIEWNWFELIEHNQNWSMWPILVNLIPMKAKEKGQERRMEEVRN